MCVSFHEEPIVLGLSVTGRLTAFVDQPNIERELYRTREPLIYAGRTTFQRSTGRLS